MEYIHALNGWYASGQAWAYIQGEVGIKVNVFGLVKKFEILELAAGVALQAKLPNPFYARGAVGGRYSILGDKVKGECNFQVEIGQHCQLEGGSELLPAFPIYNEIIPNEGQAAVSTLTTCEIVFGIPINQLFDYAGVNYEIKMDYAELRDTNGAVLLAEKTWSGGNNILSIRPWSTLPPNSEIIIAANVLIYRDGNEIGNEEKLISFFTDEALDYIPPTNVKYAYPYNGQFNFYIDEYQPNGYREGYIELITSQPDLIYNIPEGKFLNVKFSYHGTGDWEYAQQVDFDWAGSKITFALPNNLVSDKFYTAKLVYADNAPVFENANATSSGNNRPTPPNNNPPPAGQTWTGSTATATAGLGTYAGNTINDGPTASDNTDNEGAAGEEKVLYQWNFRSSEYNSFDDKINALKNQGIAENFHAKLGFNLIAQGMEPFDLLELEGNTSLEPLIKMTYGGADDPWLYPKANTNFYKYLPVNEGDVKLKLLRSNSDALPTFAVTLSSAGNYEFPLMANSYSDIIFAGVNSFTTKLNLNPFEVTKEDFDSIKRQWDDYLLTTSCMTDPTMGQENPPGALSCEQEIQELVNDLDNLVIDKIHGNNEPNLSVPNGQYKVTLDYILPGKNTSNSTQSILFTKQ